MGVFTVRIEFTRTSNHNARPRALSLLLISRLMALNMLPIGSNVIQYTSQCNMLLILKPLVKLARLAFDLWELVWMSKYGQSAGGQDA